MKLFHLEHIIETILEDVPCPRCKSELDETNLDIRSVGDKQTEIFIPCTNCGAQISICADVEERFPESFFKVVFPEKQHQRVHSGLSPQHIKDIAQRIENFKDKDVRKLF